jgi:hypothetical protein
MFFRSYHGIWRGVVCVSEKNFDKDTQCTKIHHTQILDRQIPALYLQFFLHRPLAGKGNGGGGGISKKIFPVERDGRFSRGV